MADRLQELMALIEKEDSTLFTKVIKHINTENMEGYEASTYLNTLTANEVSQLTASQRTLLKSMEFKGGHTLSFYSHPSAPMEHLNVAINNVRRDSGLLYTVGALSKDQLKYLSNYQVSKWKKANPSRTNAKGTQLTFSMDMFSLAIFKSTITKPFLRTEAKNFIIKVNEACGGTRDKDKIKIRNKFYAVIMDNTPVRTKVLVNALRHTELVLASGEYYLPDSDELLSVRLGWANRDLISMYNNYCHDEYSTDLALITHSTGTTGQRDTDRMVVASSVLLTLFYKTKHEPYRELACKMLKHIDDTAKTNALLKVEAMLELQTILKDSIE